MKNPADVIVVGGGASGMMAAIRAAECGASVLLLEGGKRPGRKILMTGNGRCNYTNRRMKNDCFRSRETGAAMRVIGSFTEKDLIAWFAERGMITAEKDGYCYPRSHQASAVQALLEQEAKRVGVHIKTNCLVKAVSGSVADGFSVRTEIGDVFGASRVILAAGGMAAPVTGSNGSGYALARGLGHSLLEPVPALVPLTAAEKFCRRWEHVRTRGRITLLIRDKKRAEAEGELQLTSYGISGIPVFQVSRYASCELSAYEKAGNTAARLPIKALINFLPEWTKEQWSAETAAESRWAKITLGQIFSGLFPDRLAEVLLSLANVQTGRMAGTLSEAERIKLWETCTSLSLTITGTRGFEAAQVTAGGIPTREVDLSTMESRFCPGLYLAGEILDVDGICGGYNLQWAFSSGWLAGQCAGEAVR